MQDVLLDKEFEIKELRYDIKNSYYKIAGRSISEELLEKEIKKYVAPRARAKADFSRYSDKTARIADIQNDQRKVIDAVFNQRKTLQNNKSIFKGKSVEYLHCLELLNKAEQYIKESIDITGKLTGLYSSIIACISTTDQLIVFINDELSSAGGVLSRSTYRDWETDRKSTRLNSSHSAKSRMPSSA